MLNEQFAAIDCMNRPNSTDQRGSNTWKYTRGNRCWHPLCWWYRSVQYMAVCLVVHDLCFEAVLHLAHLFRWTFSAVSSPILEIQEKNHTKLQIDTEKMVNWQTYHKTYYLMKLMRMEIFSQIVRLKLSGKINFEIKKKLKSYLELMKSQWRTKHKWLFEANRLMDSMAN